MKHFTKFLHFVISEKKFVFFDTKTFEGFLSEKEYKKLAFDKGRLLKFNELTLNDFKAYIDEIKDIIKNEINDVFDSGNRDQMTDVHNKLLRLIHLLSKYEKLDFEKFTIVHPNTDIDIFDDLSEPEKKQIIDFLKVERDQVYNIKEYIKKQEREFGVKVIASDFENVTGFKFKTSKNITLRVIHLLLDGSLLGCDYKTFRRVFNGEPLKSPQKIKWLIKHREMCHKRALIYFLSQPIFESVDNDEDFMAKILFSFADIKGKTFDRRNLKENIRQYNNEISSIENKLNKKDWKVLIDEKVAEIHKYLQS